MNDKVRAEFEEVFPLPSKCWWSEKSEWSEKSGAYCWAGFGVTRHPHDDLWQVWLAAKEKYERRRLPIEEDYLRMVLSLVDGGSVKQVEKLIPLIQIETSNCNEVERYAVQCWRELNTHNTQKGGK